MRERPILFSGPMVRAILAGNKTQTRRPLKQQPPAETINLYPYHHPDPRPHMWAMAGGKTMFDGGHLLDWAIPCPYGQPGDRLWVREAWQHANHGIGPYDANTPVFHRADYLDDPHGADGERSPEGRYRSWRPSIHMPRSACRLELEITRVRVERLQDITEADAIAEGIDDVTTEISPSDPEFRFWRRYRDGGWNGYTDNAIASYASLWTEINGQGSWEANPWVWVVEFRVLPTQPSKDGGANGG